MKSCGVARFASLLDGPECHAVTVTVPGLDRLFGEFGQITECVLFSGFRPILLMILLVILMICDSHTLEYSRVLCTVLSTILLVILMICDSSHTTSSTTAVLVLVLKYCALR